MSEEDLARRPEGESQYAAAFRFRRPAFGFLMGWILSVGRSSWCFIVSDLLVSRAESGSFLKRIHWNRSAIPLISFNDSIDFVERFH